MKKYSTIILTLLLILSCAKKEEKTAQNQSKMKMDESELHLSNQQIQLGNITVDSVRENILGDEFMITGIVNVNQNKTISVSSKIMGRIEKLYLKNTGDIIAKGDPLYEIYSEDINLAIRDLLLATEKYKLFKNEQMELGKIIRSSRNKLILYGLNEDQINSFNDKDSIPNTIIIFSQYSGVITSVDKKEGDYVMEGGIIFHLSDFSSLWVDGQIYSDYLNYIKEGMTAQVTFPSLPGYEFLNKITFINPELNSSSKIDFIRIELENINKELKPGMQAYINLLTNKSKVLSIPTDAIILEGKSSTVWIKTGYNMFKSRMITTGIEANGFTEITSGLNKGDLVVISGAYLLNSEFIFRKGTNPMGTHNM